MGRPRDLIEIQDNGSKMTGNDLVSHDLLFYQVQNYCVFQYIRLLLGLKSTLSVDDKLNVKQSQY